MNSMKIGLRIIPSKEFVKYKKCLVFVISLQKKKIYKKLVSSWPVGVFPISFDRKCIIYVFFNFHRK